MNLNRCLTRMVLWSSISASIAMATPPYMWYATHSVENYVGNGCGVLSGYHNLANSHEEADGFNTAIVNPVRSNLIVGRMFRYNRRDADATRARWLGDQAEINYVDFLFYSGHGTGFGPTLGCNATYTTDCRTDFRFRGIGYLKWVQASACLWFEAPQYANGVSEFSRWNASFAGVHTVQGHRAVSYEGSNPAAMSEEFWNRWVNLGESIYSAWRNAQISCVYENGAHPGLQPATMGANGTFATETYASAGDAAAPYGATWLGWATVGTPEYPPLP